MASPGCALLTARSPPTCPGPVSQDAAWAASKLPLPAACRRPPGPAACRRQRAAGPDPVAAAQLVLNTCAARLARLSTTAVAGERIAEIVEELYATERAVAVLVGTIARPRHGGHPALAPAGLAQPALMAATLDPVGGTRGSDWTTTGALLPVDGD